MLLRLTVLIFYSSSRFTSIPFPFFRFCETDRAECLIELNYPRFFYFSKLRQDFSMLFPVLVGVLRVWNTLFSLSVNNFIYFCASLWFVLVSLYPREQKNFISASLFPDLSQQENLKSRTREPWRNVLIRKSSRASACPRWSRNPRQLFSRIRVYIRTKCRSLWLCGLFNGTWSNRKRRSSDQGALKTASKSGGEYTRT